MKNRKFLFALLVLAVLCLLAGTGVSEVTLATPSAVVPASLLAGEEMAITLEAVEMPNTMRY